VGKATSVLTRSQASQARLSAILLPSCFAALENSMILLDFAACEGITHGRHCLLARRTTSGSYLRACFAVALGILFSGKASSGRSLPGWRWSLSVIDVTLPLGRPSMLCRVATAGETTDYTLLGA
jgi:hypothetical protein